MKKLDKISDVTTEMLREVDWDRVLEDDAARFGLALGDFKDACSAYNTANNMLWQHMLILTVVIGFAGLLLGLGVDYKTTLACVVATHVVIVCMKSFHCHGTKKSREETLESLKRSVARLLKK